MHIQIELAPKPVPAGVDTEADLEAVRAHMASGADNVGLADNLSTRNTLRLISEAEHLVSVSSSVELDGLLRDAPQDGVIRVLGEGSNVILHDTLAGTTIVMAIEGREVISDDGQKILPVRAQGRIGTAWCCGVIIRAFTGWPTWH